MENSKRPRILYILLAVAIIVTASVAMPATNAKYASTKTYSINIETRQLLDISYTLLGKAKATTPNSSLGVVTLTANETGYYVFVAKGGNGAAGMYKSDNSLSDNAGVGGYIYGCVYLQKNDVLNIYVGSSASDPQRAETGRWGTISTRHDSNPGQNSLNSSAAIGGNSSHLSTPSTRNSSGAGGAATVILKGSGSNASIVAVAGGAGGGGACDRGITFASSAHEGGPGGAGGNMDSPKTTVSDFLVYKGYPGTTPKNSGTSNCGSAGNTTNPLTRSGSTWSGGKGSAGSAFGGGGGGGYAGGGGGDGNGYNALLVGEDQAGGGGGGSSCIVKTLNGKDTRALKADTELSKVLALANDSSYNSSTREGFVIVAYVNNGDKDGATALFAPNVIS